MTDSLTVCITAEGHLQFVYDDALASLLDCGVAAVTRASHVEPAPAGGWMADMRPVGGPVLGPVSLRRDALALERQWLTDHLGL